MPRVDGIKGAFRMRSLASFVAATSTLASLGLLSGCYGGADTLNSMQSVSAFPVGDHQSWIKPGAQTGVLLYVSSIGNKNVTVYSLPSGTLVGALYGFSYPLGQCVDNSGDVYITDFLLSEILEYRHGELTPIKVLSDSYGPLACSVDNVTGNLAVANIGKVLVYPNASGMPTEYTNSSFGRYYFVGYDNIGNLFVDGVTQSSQSLFAWLPKGSSNLGVITLSKTIVSPSSIQFDGKYLAIGDYGVSPNVVYQFSISGSFAFGTLVGTTTLNGSDIQYGFWVPWSAKVARQGRAIVAPEYLEGMVQAWKYPAGGNAALTITSGISEPSGLTISK